jgi:hypothetical protein
VARRRSRRRKSSYRTEGELSGYPPHLVLEDLSPRARRLVEGGLIDVDMIQGSGEDGRITSGDILHAARVMEVEQSVARIEATGNADVMGERASENEHPLPPAPRFESSNDTAESPADTAPDIASEQEEGPEITDAATTSGTRIGGEPVSMPPSPWDAYNGVSEGLAESALPGAEQSWGEAEANIQAIAEEAAARAGREVDDVSPPAEEPPHSIVDTVPPALVDDAAVPAESTEAESDVPGLAETEFMEPAPTEPESFVPAPAEPESFVPAPAEPESFVPAPAEPESFVPAPEQPAPVDELVTIAAEMGPNDSEAEADPIVEQERVDAAAETPPHSQQGRVMMDFGTLELVDPESVWAEGAEDFAPWFLAHSRQLGDVLGLEAGLSEARQFTTKSATGVVGRDDSGDDVVVVSSQNAVAEDADLGHALGMAASSGAATVALVSAKFPEEQLQALAWLNNQTKSGVQWFGIEMKVVRIADSPAAMLFELVAAPSRAEG